MRDLCADVLLRGFTPSAGILLGAAGVRPLAEEADLDNIPAAGPVLVTVGAHYGSLEALAASFLLDDLRPGVRILSDAFIAAAPNQRLRFLPFDPWERRRAAAINVRAVRRGLAWLRSGGLLLAFVEENGWAAAVRTARLSRTAIVPAALIRKHRGMPGEGTIELRFGKLLSAERLSGLSDAEAIGYLRWRIGLLSRRDQPALRLVPRLAQLAGPR